MNKDTTLMVKRVIEADRERLWKALTDPEIMQKWFFAAGDGWSATVENTFKVGGAYKIEMHSPKDTYSHHGVYKEIVPLQKMVFTWNSQAVTDTKVTVTLKKLNEGTEVVLMHEFMPNEEMKKNHTEGWTQILENLEGVIIRELT